MPAPSAAVAPHAALRLHRTALPIPSGTFNDPSNSHEQGLRSPVALPASFSDSMKNPALNPAYAFAICFAAIVCLAIAVNLMPIFLTTVRVELGGRAGLSGEQLGRISAVTFAELVGGILFTGPFCSLVSRC